MKNTKYLTLFFLIVTSCTFVTKKVNAQAFDFNTFFNTKAIAFNAPDSNNMIYNEMRNSSDMAFQLDSVLPFYTQEFYGAYPLIKTSDSITFLPGLHTNLPAFDTEAAEIKGAFSLNNTTSYWYAYYKKSIVDTTTAILIFPGSGANESFHIAHNEPTDYHNLNCFIKNKDLEYGDVYIIVKPNEDFRSFWKNIGDNTYNKLDYDVMGPYTDFMGKNWAANLYIELLAQIKYLQSKYKKVIVTGLSNGGFPVLVCGLEAGVNGINCASGISVTSYLGFPVPNNENPYFGGLFDYYALDSLKKMIYQSGTRVLFSYGSGDCCTNAYEHQTHALQDTLNTLPATCNAEFFYDFSWHTFPCNGLDSFYTKVIKSPNVEIEPETDICAYDSLNVLLKLKGEAPFSFDLYKRGLFYAHYETNDSNFVVTLYNEGEYFICNLIDANNQPLCKSNIFTYTKPTLININPMLSEDNTDLVTSTTADNYYWYWNDKLIDSTKENRILSYGSGNYYVLIKDSLNCEHKSNIITQNYLLKINAYPNPAGNYINIVLDTNFIGSYTYRVFDIQGKMVSVNKSNKPHLLLKTRKLASGIYNLIIDYTDANNKAERTTINFLKK
jgi:hypothetical protein